MRMPNHVYSCICFLDAEHEGTWRPIGTAFFATHRDTKLSPSFEFLYLVTAKHCIMRPDGTVRGLCARINKDDDSGVLRLKLLAEMWAFPEDPGVDIAVIALNPPKDSRILGLPVETFLSTKTIDQYGVGWGDITTTIGLLATPYGLALDMPIVRAGIIAAMPGPEFIHPTTAARYRAYLIEMTSLAGLSGSPVFVSIPPHRAPEETKHKPNDGYSVPLGVIHGHERVAGNARQNDSHSGIAIVTPIQEVTTVILTSPLLIQRRRELELALRAGVVSIDPLY